MTKQEIDALFDAGANVLPGWTTFRLSREEAYLAAGLNADGSEKAKVVRATVWVERQSPDAPAYPAQSGTWDGTTFTPDGAA